MLTELYLKCIVFAVVIYIGVSSVVIFFFMLETNKLILVFCLIVDMVVWFCCGVTAFKM